MIQTDINHSSSVFLQYYTCNVFCGSFHGNSSGVLGNQVNSVCPSDSVLIVSKRRGSSPLAYINEETVSANLTAYCFPHCRVRTHTHTHTRWENNPAAAFFICSSSGCPASLVTYICTRPAVATIAIANET